MKKYRFGICVGIIIAGMVALIVGGTEVSILAGILFAGITTWFVTIPWEKVKKTKALALNLAYEMMRDIWQVAKKTTLTVVWHLPLAIVWYLPLAICRKIIQGITALLSFCREVIQGICYIPVVLWQFALTFWNNKNGRSSVLIGYIFTVSPYILFILIFVFYEKPPSIFMAFTVAVWMGLVGANVIGALDSDRNGCEPWAGGFYGWAVNLKNDRNRGPVMANLYLAKIRGWNALKIVMYLIRFGFWCLVVLPNNKTRMSTVSAVTISGAYLVTAHHFGGIDIANPAFWLSLGIALIAGVGIGNMIGKMKRRVSHSSLPIPTIKFRKYIPRGG